MKTLLEAIAEKHARRRAVDRAGSVTVELLRARHQVEEAKTNCRAAAGKPPSIREAARIQLLDALAHFEECAAAAREAEVISHA